MLVSPLRTDMKVDPEFFTEEWAPVSKLLSPGDIIGDGSEDSTVMINYVELGKKVGRDFRYKILSSSINIALNISSYLNKEEGIAHLLFDAPTVNMIDWFST